MPLASRLIKFIQMEVAHINILIEYICMYFQLRLFEGDNTNNTLNTQTHQSSCLERWATQGGGGAGANGLYVCMCLQRERTTIMVLCRERGCVYMCICVGVACVYVPVQAQT